MAELSFVDESGVGLPSPFVNSKNVIPRKPGQPRFPAPVIIGMLLMAIVLLGVGYLYVQMTKPDPVLTYEECMNTEGSIVQESSPQTCISPDGGRFIEPSKNPNIVLDKPPLPAQGAPVISTKESTTPSPVVKPRPTPSMRNQYTAKLHEFPEVGVTAFTSNDWKSERVEFTDSGSTLLRFWEGATSETATIQIAVKPNWDNTGDAQYLPRTITVAGGVRAARVDPPKKEERVLDRYQSNIFFETNGSVFVVECVHNWIPRNMAQCDAIVQTLQLSRAI